MRGQAYVMRCIDLITATAYSESVSAVKLYCAPLQTRYTEHSTSHRTYGHCPLLTEIAMIRSWCFQHHGNDQNSSYGKQKCTVLKKTVAHRHII